MAISATDFGTLLDKAQGRFLKVDQQDRKRQAQLQVQQRQIDKGLNAGLSWESISRQTGIPLNIVTQYSQQTRPDYGIKKDNKLLKLGGKLKNLGYDIGKGVVQPFAEFGNAVAHVPQAVTREIQNKPITDIQQKVFGTSNSGQIAKKIVGDTAQIGLSIAAPTANVGRSTAARVAINVGAGAGFGGAQGLANNESLPQVAESAAIGGALGAAVPAAAKLVKQTLKRGKNVASTVVPEDRRLPAQGSVGAPVITDKSRLLEPGKVNPNLAQRVEAANPALIKQLNQVTKRIRDAQVNGGITADEARSLVQERQSLVRQIQGKARVENAKIQTENTVINPESNLSHVVTSVAQSQSALADSIKQNFPHLKSSIQNLTHEVHNQKVLTQNANKLVNEDAQAAADIFSSGSLVQVNPDAHIKLGQVLAYQAAKSGDTAQLNRVLGEHAASLTNHAQAMRAAATTNLLSPKTIVTYAAKKADQSGRKLTGDTISKLEGLAAKIDKMPDGPEKTKALLQMKGLAENPTVFQKGARFGGQVLASFRAILASTDLSGGGRQGGVLFSRFPAIGAKAEALGAKAAFSSKVYESEIKKLANLTDDSGVSLTQVFDRMKLGLQAVKGGAEEQFANAALVEKVPGIGHAIQGSERAYNLTLAYMRAHATKELIDAQGGAQAVMEKWNTAQFRALGRVLDTITGRGRGGSGNLGQIFEKAAPTLGQTLFSARLWKSRLDLLNPLYYAEVAKNPVAFKLAVRSGLQFATTIGVVLAAAAAAGAKVETDLRSSDFGKIKIGNTRIDIMGGLQQNIVLAWRELKGQYKSSSTGNVSDLNSGEFGAPNRLTVAGRTVENKLSPVIGEIIHQIQGTDISGKKMTTEDRLKSLGGNFVPLAIQDVYSGLKDSGASSLPLTASGFFGTGASTYGPPETDWNKSTSKTLDKFKKTVSPQQFSKANKEFNDTYNAWLKDVNDNSRYQKLSIKDQATVRSSKKQEIQKKVLEKYGFESSASSNDQLKRF